MLCSHVLGNGEQEGVSMISKTAGTMILTELVNKLLSVLQQADSEWVRRSARIISSSTEDVASEEVLERHTERDDTWLQGTSALDVVGGCIHALLLLDSDSKSSAQVVATVYLLKWALLGQMPNLRENIEDYGSEDDELSDCVGPQTVFGEKAKQENGRGITLAEHPDTSLCAEATKSVSEFLDVLKAVSDKVLLFTERLSPLSKNHLRRILCTCIRCAVSEIDLKGYQLITRCGNWVLELTEYSCQEVEDVDQTVEYILAGSTFWPVWTDPLSRDQINLPVLRFSGNQTKVQVFVVI